MYGEKTWQQLHKDAPIEQVLETASNKAPAVRPIITHHEIDPS